ncbi:MAG: tetratricopeptide repeat protein [Candidatus Bathyarchaeia archaeon]
MKEVLENPDVPDGRIRGLFLRHRRGAETLLRRVLEAYPRDLNAFNYLVNLLEAEGRYEEADREFRGMIKNLPRDPWLRLGYALFLRDWGLSEEARAQYRKAIELDPLEPLYRVEYARFLEGEGDRRARKVYKTALTLFPQGSRIRTLLKRKLRGEEELWKFWCDPPSAGTLGRFTRRHHREIFNSLKQLNALEAGKLWAKLPSPPESPFLKKAMETGRYVEVLLEVDASKDDVEVDDPEDWAHLEELNILNSWKLGFELYVNKLFFDKRCKGCGMRGRRKMGCREGLSNCVFDNEYDEFERECVQKIIRKLKRGIEPQRIRELQVPKSLEEIEIRTHLQLNTPRALPTGLILLFLQRTRQGGEDITSFHFD